jgi:hypothetical protein
MLKQNQNYTYYLRTSPTEAKLEFAPSITHVSRKKWFTHLEKLVFVARFVEKISIFNDINNLEPTKF